MGNSQVGSVPSAFCSLLKRSTRIYFQPDIDLILSNYHHGSHKTEDQSQPMNGQFSTGSTGALLLAHVGSRPRREEHEAGWACFTLEFRGVSAQGAPSPPDEVAGGYQVGLHDIRIVEGVVLRVGPSGGEVEHFWRQITIISPQAAQDPGDTPELDDRSRGFISHDRGVVILEKDLPKKL